MKWEKTVLKNKFYLLLDFLTNLRWTSKPVFQRTQNPRTEPKSKIRSKLFVKYFYR